MTRREVLPAITRARWANYITLKRQNLRQTKITETIPEKETDLTSLPEKEFKINVINMLMEMQRNIQELRD